MKARRARKPDAQAFDEVRFVTVPRYKTSGLSGDEWRISITIQFYRNGQLVHESGGYSKMETAMGFAYADYCRAVDEGYACFAGEGDFCDQEGCSEKATVKCTLKASYCRDGHKSELHNECYRLFCKKHSTRGDCGLDDADKNYIKETL